MQINKKKGKKGQTTLRCCLPLVLHLLIREGSAIFSRPIIEQGKLIAVLSCIFLRSVKYFTAEQCLLKSSFE